MRKLNVETKASLEQSLNEYLNNKSVPPDGQYFLLKSWIIGLLENVDEHGDKWFEPKGKC